MAGGMFAISYTIAVIIPVLCGAFWDLTGLPWTLFLPVGVCAITLTALGFLLTMRAHISRQFECDGDEWRWLGSIFSLQAFSKSAGPSG